MHAKVTYQMQTKFIFFNLEQFFTNLVRNLNFLSFSKFKSQVQSRPANSEQQHLEKSEKDQSNSSKLESLGKPT